MPDREPTTDRFEIADGRDPALVWPVKIFDSGGWNTVVTFAGVVMTPDLLRRLAAEVEKRVVTGLATLQVYSRARAPLSPGGTTYTIHLVRSTATGTPGPALCGLERFGPAAPGWSLSGGESGPNVIQSPCWGCAGVAAASFPGLLPRASSVGGTEMREAINIARGER